MKKTSIILIIVGVILIFGCGKCVSVRNSIVTADQQVKKTWGDVENQYQRRLDLIPNLVNTVKGYAQHESETYIKVTEARAGLKTAYDAAKQQAGMQSEPTEQEMAQFQEAQANLNHQLGIYINAVHEAYPDLKANENFMNLQTQLEGTENRIATERTRYNDAVEGYNNLILRFPGSLFAWGYSEKAMFKADPGASHAPKVDFGTGSADSDDF